MSNVNTRFKIKKGGLGRLFCVQNQHWSRHHLNPMVAAAIMVNVAMTGMTTVITAVSR
jgi:hypothetical protein